MTAAQSEGRAGSGLPPSLWRPAANILAIALTLLAVAWSVNLPRYLGVAFYPQQFIAAMLALALPLAFLTLPFDRTSERTVLPWYDCLAALVSLVSVAYVAIYYPSLVNGVFAMQPDTYVPSIVIILLMLEALRRATGWILVGIVVVFLLYGLFGNLAPGRLAGRAQDWRMLSAYMAFDSNGILGLPMAVATTVVVAFILFGNLLSVTGGSKFFTDAALIGMGSFRGGAMKIAVLASGLFGSISGSAVANVVATGVVTIPMIKRDGYPGHKAAAIEAVASTGGQLMPPVMGAAAFLMAEFLQVPYADVALAALLPAVLYYLALFIQADLEAARLGISAVPRSEIPKGRLVATGLHFLLAFAILIYALFNLSWQPEKAALAAALAVIATGLLIGYQKERPSLRAVLATLAGTGHAVLEIILISAAAGIVIGILNVTGLSFNLTYALVQVGGGSAIILLLLSALVCIVLGMGLPTLGVYVLLATLVAPALIEVGIQPMAAHLYVLYFGMMSMITPPIAIAAFAAASIAKAPAMATGWAAMRFGWSAYVIPILFVFSPTLILIGEPVEIAIAIVTACVGVWLISAGLAGYLAKRLSPVMRALFIFFGLMSLIPAGAFSGAVYTDIVGVIGGIALIALEFYRSGRTAEPVPSSQ